MHQYYSGDIPPANHQNMRFVDEVNPIMGRVIQVRLSCYLRSFATNGSRNHVTRQSHLHDPTRVRVHVSGVTAAATAVAIVGTATAATATDDDMMMIMMELTIN